MEFLKKIWSRTVGGVAVGSAGLFQPDTEHALYVVGDIHGRDDLLARLVEMIDADVAENAIASPRIVFVGDYIDRGEQSAQVLRRLHALETDAQRDVVCLIGNHEEMMLDFLNTPSLGRRWLRNGGLQTLASFGVGGVTDTSGDEVMEEVSAKLGEAVGAELEDWLRQLPMTSLSGNVVVVHAAMDPELPIAEQSDTVMTWGHPAFMRTGRDDGLCIVHGHTIVDEAKLEPSRVPVDTGAVFTGKLTAAVLIPGALLRFLQT